MLIALETPPEVAVDPESVENKEESDDISSKPEDTEDTTVTTDNTVDESQPVQDIVDPPPIDTQLSMQITIQNSEVDLLNESKDSEQKEDDDSVSPVNRRPKDSTETTDVDPEVAID